MTDRRDKTVAELRQKVADMERDTLNRLHQLDRETSGDIEGLANLEKAVAFFSAGRIAEEYRRDTGEEDLPPEAEALIRDFLEQAKDRADLLTDAASVERRMAERGARGLMARQRRESEGNRARASKQRNRKLADAIETLAREPGTPKELWPHLYGLLDAHREVDARIFYLDELEGEQAITLKTFANRLRESRKKSR